MPLKILVSSNYVWPFCYLAECPGDREAVAMLDRLSPEPTTKSIH